MSKNSSQDIQEENLISTTQKTDKTATYNSLEHNIHVLDDLVPTWLHNSAKKTALHWPLGFGHTGLGPNQGYEFWSEQWGDSAGTEPNTAPWEFWAIWLVLNENKKRISPDVTTLQCNQIQLNFTTKNHFGNRHVDVQNDTPAYTMVYLLRGDSGMEFWANKDDKIHSVPWKEGRAVIFPSSMIHGGLPPQEVSPRLTLGYIFSGEATPIMRQHKVIHPIFNNNWKLG